MREKKKILIVEDELDMAKLLSAALRNTGYDTVTAPDGLLGTQRAHKEKPDLIVLDLMLPAGGGFGVLENLKSSIETADIPVVIYSAFKDDEHIKKAKEKGADAYFDKTCDLNELIDTIRNLLGEKKGE